MRRTIGFAFLAFLIACSGEPTSPIEKTPVVPKDSTPVAPPPPPKEIPVTGMAVPELASFEQVITDFMRQYDVPGGAFAVMLHGKLIYARGFGYADVENKTLVQPDALFRVASVSKTLTSAAIFKLIEEGRLELDDFAAPFIEDLKPPAGATVDPRWGQVTIRQLLNHSGGWDREKKPGGFDPIDRTVQAAAVVGVPAPASGETLIRYMKGMPLDFEPGERFAYSNFGFIILGAIIERVSGMPYEDFVRSRVLLPVGATRTRQGKSRLSEAYPDEVKYYVAGFGVNAPLVPSVFPGEGMAPFNYGGAYMEAGFSSGAWVSSTIDLLRFLGGVDGRSTRPDILAPETIGQMISKSNGMNLCAGGACYYSGGWFVRPMGGEAIWWHSGTGTGSTTMLIRSFDGFAFVGLINLRSFTTSLETPLYNALWSGLNNVTSSPSHDLFSTFR